MELAELKNLGLTEGEIKVYDALLDLGDCTKTALAKRSSVAPANIYDITNRLSAKGLISIVEKDKVTHFSPASPRNLLAFLEDKKSEIEKEKKIAESLLPSMLMRFSEKKEKINVEVFRGWKGLKAVFEGMLDECKKDDKSFVFGASKGEREKTADAFFLKYSKMREEKGIRTKIIFNNELKKRKERIEFFLKSKMYEIRFLNQSTPAEIMCYKDKTCIILLTKEPLSVRITGKEATDSFRQHFEMLWEMAKT